MLKARTHKKLVLLMVLVMLFLLPISESLPLPVAHAVGSTYFVDSVNGNDVNNGLSPGSAFKTLTKLNSITFAPGDKILFKQGCTWNGYFKPNGSGTSQNPIIVNAYDSNGNEATGAVALNDKPYIKCNGADQTGDSRIQFQHAYSIHLKNVEYWELNNIQCSVDNDNTWQGTFGDVNHSGSKWTSSTNIGRDWVGIMVEASDYDNGGDRTINHVYLKNMYVHDVDGNYALWHKDGFSGGITYLIWTNAMNDGVFSATEQATIPINTFDDILVENCYIKNSSRAGITAGTSVWANKFDGYGGVYPDSVMNTYASKNITIRNNVVEMLTGDGIEVLYAVAPMVEKNLAINFGQDTLNNNSDEFTSAGIWCWRSPNAVFQYNEAYGGDNWGDGQAYDVDWTYAVTYQYNYSHDNRGGAVMFCGGESLNSTYRYNISHNDKYFWDDLSNGGGNKVYNNTFIAGSYTAGVMRRSGGAETVENNIFYVPVGRSISANWDYNDSFGYNCYYNISAPSGDSYAVTGNPSLVNPAQPSAGTYSSGPHNTANYLADKLSGIQLNSNSPCINAGKTIANNGAKDFWGNTLYNGSPDIGAFEYQGTVPTPTPTPTPLPTPTPIPGGVYPTISGNTSYEYINNVTIGSINNTSGNNSGYGNYTNISADIVRNSSVSVSITPGFTSRTSKEYFKVWIDYNKDSDFTDSGEEVFSSSGRSSVSGSFTVPMSAATGTTRMRVALKNGGYPASSGSLGYGEAEDYIVNIQ